MRSSAILMLAAVALISASACAASAPCPSASRSGLPEQAFVAKTPSPPPVAPQAALPAEHESSCWAKGRPKVTTPKKEEQPSCAAFDPREVAKVEARVRKEIVVREKPSMVVVDFGCDVSLGTPRDVFFEDGSGHGGSLRIVRFRRETDKVTVRMIDTAHYSAKRVDVRAGDVDAKSFDALVASSRVAMLVRPHVVRLRDLSGKMSFGGYSSSSNDFHLSLAIVDDVGRATERQFSGYDSSHSQDQILPMRFATEPLQRLLTGAAFAKVTPTDEDRELFTERLLLTLSGKPFWWVKERYVAIAAHLGTIDALPPLVALLAAPPGPSEDRTREAALDAIAAITGWNPRVDAMGKARTTEQASAVALAECRP